MSRRTPSGTLGAHVLARLVTAISLTAFATALGCGAGHLIDRSAISAGGGATVTVAIVESFGFGKTHHAVELDGRPIAELADGAYLTLPIEPGIHFVAVIFPHTDVTSVVEFSVSAGEHQGIVCKSFSMKADIECQKAEFKTLEKTIREGNYLELR
jgi:hypothetical protein